MNRLFSISRRFATNIGKCGRDCNTCPLNKSLKIDGELSLKILRRKQTQREEETQRFYQKVGYIPNDFINHNLYFMRNN